MLAGVDPFHEAKPPPGAYKGMLVWKLDLATPGCVWMLLSDKDPEVEEEEAETEAEAEEALGKIEDAVGAA